MIQCTYNKSSESISRKTVHKVPEMGNLAIGKNNTEEDLFLWGARMVLITGSMLDGNPTLSNRVE